MSERDQKRLIALLEKQLGVKWADIVEWLRSQNSLEEIERRLATGGNVIAGVEDAAKKLAADTHAAYVTSGQTQAEWLDAQKRTKDVLVRFEQGHQNVINRARANELELVQGFKEEQNQIAQQITQRALVEGARTGTNPNRVAQDFRASIGLTPNQEQWAANYRRSLETGDHDRALGYELSSGIADRAVRSAQAKSKALTPEQIDKFAEEYRQNAITYRAETIARTEGLRAAHEGADESMRQAVSRGDVDADELIVEWHAGPNTLDAREQHQAMDEKTVRFGELFVLPDGTRMTGPGDPNGGAKHNANCRCTKSTRIDLDRAPKELDIPVRAAPAPAFEQPPPVYEAPKNPKRVAAAKVAAAASVERRREIQSAARSNLPPELHVVWDAEGYKFMQQETARIKGVKDRVNAASMLSQAFMEKYGDGGRQYEGDAYQRRSEIVANHAESWADEQERKYYEAQAARDVPDDDEPPF